jgi:hypothetical protein
MGPKNVCPEFRPKCGRAGRAAGAVRAHQGAPLVSVATSEKARALPLVPGLQDGHNGDGLAVQQRLPSTHTAHESPSGVTALPAGHSVQAASGVGRLQVTVGDLTEGIVHNTQ